METKASQLQIRVSARQKRQLRRLAKQAGMTVSEWVLRRALPPKRDELEQIVRAVARGDRRSTALAALHDLLAGLEAGELEAVLGTPPSTSLPPPWGALVAAMVEHAAAQKGAPVPTWVLQTPPTWPPYFASQLDGLRLHLLASSPPAFRRRNLFVDTSVGGRV